ncbi:cyclase family protein [uncultured Pseudoramibacter sp.]|uniref:cyclase family protein n=1 Tax=uncultured Pseudoramibacter sp. TaxID=1623493 RepID=UPI0025E87E28|nr:cyclase family protein [uncultured Pseudoramibacter sp.]
MKKDYHDMSWLQENAWGKYGLDDEVGALNQITNPETVIHALSLVKEGQVYDLETERFKGMNMWQGHCGFEMVTYATPSGRQRMQSANINNAYSFYAPGGIFDSDSNAPQYNMGLNTEMLISPLHIGTHIDSLCHFSAGEDNHIYNGFPEKAYGHDFGSMRCGAETIPPIITRGILLDIASYKGKEQMPDDYIISAEDCEGCADWENITLRPGDAVFMRLGAKWPDAMCGTAGVGISAARYLVEECGAVVIGDDNGDIDGHDKDGHSSVPHHPNPVHHYLLIQQGVHIMEYVTLNALAKDQKYEFCFICLPAKIRGATAMFTRPIALT